MKITAYDYSIYGGLKGKVTVISPDTLRDEVKQDQFYYRVYIRTDSDKLRNAAGQEFNITPGMVASVIFVPAQNGNGLSDQAIQQG